MRALAVLLLAAAAWWPAATALAADRRAEGLPPPDRREVVGRLLEILQRPEFEGSEEEEEGLLLLLANLLSDFLDRVKELRRTDPVVYHTIVGWLVITLVVIVGHVAWTVWRGGIAGPRRARGGDPLLEAALASRTARDPDRMLARAAALAGDGRRAEATPWLYLALLFRLERAGRVEFDAARTGLEYADALARHPAERRRWLRFLDDHDPVVFGERPCSDEAFGRMRALAEPPVGEEVGDAQD
jgi:hypothetical protein